MKTKTTLFAWETGFPSVCGQTSISFLKRLSDFDSAKRGDLDAAKKIVSRCVNRQRILEIKRRYPNAELIPVITDNQLPLALAQAIGLKICPNIVKTGNNQRKTMNAMERLLHQPTFFGHVKRKTEYILVDDIVTQGGTVAALRRHVIAGGGTVVAVVALAYACGSEKLSPEHKNVRLLEQRFGYRQIGSILREYLILRNSYELTNQQVLYLLRFHKITSLLNKISATLSREG